ncbi:MAG: hypothetical protein BWY22_01470 [Bacteroidetes bacterium ADurb.Bin217]|nr:MAG: hypothetical protein BWY22_01470 [Bacteroidetes bacterium ADurb.Bin217]
MNKSIILIYLILQTFYSFSQSMSDTLYTNTRTNNESLLSKKRNQTHNDSICSAILQGDFINIGVSFVYSYYNYPHSIGFGVAYNWNREYNKLFPIFIDYKYYFSNTKISPFLAIDLGRTIIQNSPNGYHINLFTGFRNKVFEKLYMNYSIGLSWYSYDGNEWLLQKDRYNVKPDLKIGFSYKL